MSKADREVLGAKLDFAIRYLDSLPKTIELNTVIDELQDVIDAILYYK